MSSASASITANDILQQGETKYRVNKKSKCGKFLQQFKLIKFIDCGFEGCVYQACLTKQGERQGNRQSERQSDHDEKTDTDDCDYVIKIIPSKQGLQSQEAKLSKLMGIIGIGPRVIAIESCEAQYKQGDVWKPINLLMIMMEKLQMSLEQYINLYPKEYELDKENIDRQIHALQDKLLNAGWEHKDLHFDNILVNINDKNAIWKLRFIDFSMMKKL